MGHVPMQWTWLQKSIDTPIYHRGISTETRKKNLLPLMLLNGSGMMCLLMEIIQRLEFPRPLDSKSEANTSVLYQFSHWELNLNKGLKSDDKNIIMLMLLSSVTNNCRYE